MSSLWQDIRFSLRLLVKNPSFTLVAIMTLALGIGANTAIFSVVNAVLLRPLDFKDSDRLVMLWNWSSGFDNTKDWLSTAEYFDLKSQCDVFDEIAVSIGGGFNLAAGDLPERVDGLRVSASFFSLLSVTPASGRAFQAAEDEPGQPLTVILSHALWQRLLGADPNVIGKPLMLNGQAATIIGVMPAGFSVNKEVIPTTGGIERADVLLPLPLDAEAQRYRGNESYNVVARLKPGVTLQQAQAQVSTIAAGLKQEYPVAYPPDSGFTIRVVPLLEQVAGEARSALLMLLGAVAFVLLIACANVANLMLSRTAARQKELAIRAAIGASRLRLIRQLLTESTLLALAGGGLGLLVAGWGLGALKNLSPDNVPRLAEIRIDARVLAFSFIVSLVTGMLFGLTPARTASQVDLNEALKESGRNAMGGPRSRRLRDTLVVTEIALSLVLLVGAGLLIRSFSQLQQVNPGFSALHALSLRLALIGPKYPDNNARAAFYSQLWERLEKLPGVEAAGGVSSLPLSAGIGWGNIWVDGFQPETVIRADHRVASPHYFRAMGIPLLKGRTFDEHDLNESEKVALVDETLVERFWPNEDPIGKRIKLGPLTSRYPLMKVIGVVGRVKQYALDAEAPRVAFYTPPAQDITTRSSIMYIVTRTAFDPAPFIKAVTTEIQALDSALPAYNVRSMEGRLSDSLIRRRFSLLLLGLFAALALILASSGIYSVISYSVTQRTPEIGIRLALGATRRDVSKLVVRQGLALISMGIAIGCGAAFALTRLMSSLLFSVSATDPLTFCGVAALLTLTALLACYIPARRATKVDPMVALRCE